MSSDHDEPIDDQDELYEDVPPRSIFAATWFRVVLVVIVLGVVGAVAIPYVLDWMNPPPAPRTVATTRSPLTPTAAPLTPTAPSPADKAVIEDKKESSTIIPAPAAPSPVAASEPKSEAKATSPAPTTKPAPEPSTAKASVPEPKAEAKTQTAMAVTESSKSPMTKPSLKPEAASKGDATTAASKTMTKSATAKATTSAAGGNGPYWVQIGAFKDADTAKRVAAKLREENFKVEESVKRVGGGASAAATPGPAPKAAAPAPSSSDQYDVFVAGMAVDELNRRLAGKGLSAESAGGGVVVKPSLPLRDAVALSKDLAVDGFKVQVRRSGAAASAPAIVSQPSPTPAAATEGGLALHRVRVGAFTDRAAALAAARELENKGFKPYIARGDQ